MGKFNKRRGNNKINGACGGDPLPSYGLGRLILYSLLLLLSGWLFMIAGSVALGACAFCLSNFVLMSPDERRKCWTESRTRPIKPWQVAISLMSMAPLFVFIGLVIFNDGRIPDFSPETRSLLSRIEAWAKVLKFACAGAFVVFVANAILTAWERWFASRRAGSSPRSR